MTDDVLVGLLEPVLSPLAKRMGAEHAAVAVVRLLNAAALDAYAGTVAHGDRLLEAVAGADAPAALRRQLAAMVAARRDLWPVDRRILEDWDIEAGDGGVMLRTRCADLDARSAAQLAVHLIVEVPPASMEELSIRLSGLRRDSVAAALRRWIERMDVPDALVDLMAASFEAVGGPGRQARPLARMAADQTLPAHRRSTAWRVLVATDPEQVDAILDDLGPEVVDELTGLGFGAVLRRIGSSPELAAGLGNQLSELPAEVRRDVLGTMERVRAEEGIPASALYGRLLAERVAPEVDDLLLPAVVRDGGHEAEEALSAALQAESDPERAMVLRRALFELRGARLEPGELEDDEDTHAWIGICDGQGAFPVVLQTENERGRHRLASVVVRAGADLRDGFVAEGLETPRLEALLDRYQETAELVEVEPAVAAALVEEGVEGTTGGLGGLPTDVRRAADEVLRRGRRGTEIPEVVPRVGRLTITACRALYEHPTLDSWFLDQADLEACGIPRPPAGADASLRWTREHAEHVQDLRVRGRLVSMLRHLALVLALQGDTEAGVAARAADELEQGRGAPFLRALLEHTALSVHPIDVPTGLALRFGDEALREDLRRQLGVERPTGRDVAALDVLDLLLCSDQDLFTVHVDAARVRPDVRRAVLVEVGKHLASAIGEGRDPVHTQAELIELLEAGGVPAPGAAAVTRAVLQMAWMFLDEVCTHCPVGCWGASDVPMARPWAGPGHPAFSG